MKHLLILLMFTALSFSQYTLGKGMYLSVDYNQNFHVYNETVENAEKKEIDESYRGNGQTFGLGFTYKLDNANMFLLRYTRRNSDIETSSTFLKDNYNLNTKITTDSVETLDLSTHSIRLQYFKTFHPRKFVVGFGVEYDFDKKNSDSNYIQGTKERIAGLLTLGVNYDSRFISVFPYAEYTFPIMAFKSDNNNNTIDISEFTLGLRFSMKLF